MRFTRRQLELILHAVDDLLFSEMYANPDHFSDEDHEEAEGIVNQVYSELT